MSLQVLRRLFPEFSRVARHFDEPLAPFAPKFLSPFEDFMKRPLVDVKESEKDYLIEAELPGMKKDDIKIEFTDENTLQISGRSNVEKNETKKENGYTWRISERESQDFARSFSFPANIQAEKIDATYKDGVLTVSIPKQERKMNVVNVEVKG